MWKKRLLHKARWDNPIVFVIGFFIITLITIHQSSNPHEGLSEEQLKELNMIQDSNDNSLQQDFDCSILNKIKDSNRNKELYNLDRKTKMKIKDAKGKEHYIEQRPLFNCLSADDPYLTGKIKEELMVSPTKRDFYDNDEKVVFHSHQELDVYEMVFSDMKSGFFLEAGAGDCTQSVTATLESRFNWTGLLVEAVPEFFQRCKETKRDAYLINTCLAVENTPHYKNFDLKSVGHINLTDSKNSNIIYSFAVMQGFNGVKTDKSVQLQCLPLVSLLFALGNPTVNFFVLDIEGFELAVLRTIPWDKVDIEVLSVETDLAGKFQKDSSRQAIIDLITSKGYTRFNHRKR